MKKYHIATVGSGKIIHWVMDNIVRTENLEYSGVYSRTEEKARVLAGEYGVDKVYGDYRAMLDDPDIDFVYVASPNACHYRQVKRALLCGKNVMCEKPFCVEARHAEELVRLARERGLYLIDMTPTAYFPNLSYVKEFLPEIGRVRLVMSNYSQYSSRYDLLKKGEVTNIFNPAFSGGSLMDINSYNLYMNSILFGEAPSAVYEANCFRGIDTSGSVLLRYPDFISQNCGAKDTFGRNYFQAEGEEGYIYVEGGSNACSSVTLTTKGGERTENVQRNANRWSYVAEGVSKLLGGEDREGVYSILEKQTLPTMRMLEKSWRSAGLAFHDFSDDEVLS